MIHWLTINNHPSNPQQPIHSLLSTSKSILVNHENPLSSHVKHPRDMEGEASKISGYKLRGGGSWESNMGSQRNEPIGNCTCMPQRYWHVYIFNVHTGLPENRLYTQQILIITYSMNKCTSMGIPSPPFPDTSKWWHHEETFMGALPKSKINC